MYIQMYRVYFISYTYIGDNTTARTDVITINKFKSENESMFDYVPSIVSL